MDKLDVDRGVLIDLVVVVVNYFDLCPVSQEGLGFVDKFDVGKGVLFDLVAVDYLDLGTVS